MDVRTAADGTIVSYDINTADIITTRHRKFLMKLHNSPVSSEETQTVDTDRTEQDKERVAPEGMVTRSKSRKQPVSQ